LLISKNIKPKLLFLVFAHWKELKQELISIIKSRQFPLFDSEKDHQAYFLRENRVHIEFAKQRN